MKENIVYHILAIILSIAFLALYFYVMGTLYSVDVWRFPLIILTLYFIVAFFSYPFIALDASAFALKVKLIRSLVQVGAFIIAPILLIRKIIVRRGHSYEKDI